MMVLSSALESLPENMRQILNLAGMENLSYEQIADILDVPLGTVRSRLSRPARLRQHGSAGRAALLKRLRGPPQPDHHAPLYQGAFQSGRTSPAMRGGRPGWPRGDAPPSRNGFSNCGSCAWGTGMASGAAPLGRGGP